jgi:hypothetical protein
LPHFTVAELITLLIIGGVLAMMVQFGDQKFLFMLLIFGAGFYLADFTQAGPQVVYIVDTIRGAFRH